MSRDDLNIIERPKPRLPLLAPRRQILRTTDVDEARRAFSDLYGAAALEPALGVPFDFASNVISCGDVHIAMDAWEGGGHVVVPMVGERYIVSSPVAGGIEGEHAGEGFVMVPGRRGALFSPAQAGALRVRSGHQVHNINIERAALEAHLTALTGKAPSGPLLFETAMDIERGPGAAVAGLAQLLLHEAQRTSPSRLVITALRDALLTTLLTGPIHSASALLAAPAPLVTPACVRRAEEYINAHAAEPITLEDIVAAVGVPARSLQASFQRYRGTTPMAFLKQRRLDLARLRLVCAGARSTVASVARALGIGNVGRFAVEYKKRFGESPSETRARSFEAALRREEA